MTDEKRPEVLGRDFKGDGNDVSGYIGAGDEYRNYANPTEKPYLAKGDLARLHDEGGVTDAEIDAAKIRSVAEGTGNTVDVRTLAAELRDEDRDFHNEEEQEGTETVKGETSYSDQDSQDGDDWDRKNKDEDVDDGDKEKREGDDSNPAQGPENSSGANTSDSGFAGRKL